MSPVDAPPSTHERLRGRAAEMAGAIWKAAVEVVVPPVCAACQVRIGSPDSLCADCWRSVAFIRPPVCDRLGVPLPYATGERTISAGAIADPPDYDRARVVGHFATALRQLIHQFKYGDLHHARRLFGAWLVGAGADLLSDADLVVPVPLHRSRLLHRRFNQAAVLAGEIARRTGRQLDTASLVRIKATLPQVGHTREQRRAAMAGAFAVPPRRRGRVEGRRIVLVDDVVTTGATANACARALRKAGAARIDVLALALVTEQSDLLR